MESFTSRSLVQNQVNGESKFLTKGVMVGFHLSGLKADICSLRAQLRQVSLGHRVRSSVSSDTLCRPERPPCLSGSILSETLLLCPQGRSHTPVYSHRDLQFKSIQVGSIEIIC